MWIKDGNGNWFMASQEIIDQQIDDIDSNSCWDKDHLGNWYLKEGTVQVLLEPMELNTEEKIYMAS